MSVSVHRCPSMSIPVQLCPSTYIPVKRRPSLSIFVQHCPLVSIPVHPCPSLTIIVQQYPSLVVCVRICPLRSILARRCLGRFSPVRLCLSTSKLVHLCPSMSIPVHKRPPRTIKAFCARFSVATRLQKTWGCVVSLCHRAAAYDPLLGVAISYAHGHRRLRISGSLYGRLSMTRVVRCDMDVHATSEGYLTCSGNGSPQGLYHLYPAKEHSRGKQFTLRRMYLFLCGWDVMGH